MIWVVLILVAVLVICASVVAYSLSRPSVQRDLDEFRSACHKLETTVAKEIEPILTRVSQELTNLMNRKR